MKCVKCGNELGENDMFCPMCGTPVKKVNEEVKNQNTYTYDRQVNQQINYGQANNYRQQYEKSKNTNNTLKICLIVIIVIIVLACSFVVGRIIIKKVTDKKVDNGDVANNTNSNTTVISDKKTNDTGKVESISKTNTYKVKFEGFKLYIPDNLIYETDYSDEVINIGNTESTWIAQFGIRQVAFQKVKQSKSVLNASLAQQFPGATVSNATTETIGGVEYILLEANISGVNTIIGFAEMNSMNSAFFCIFNENNDFDKSPIKNISYIINNAEYTGDSSYIKSNEDIKVTDINKALDKAIEENK